MRPPEFRKAACCLNCRNRHTMATRWCLKYPNAWGGDDEMVCAAFEFPVEEQLQEEEKEK